MSKTPTTRYGVTHKGSKALIGELLDTPEEATQHSAWVAGQAASIGLNYDDLQVVTVEETVSYGQPKVYKPEPEPVEESPAEEPAGGEQG
jgi:hypothetical protein